MDEIDKTVTDLIIDSASHAKGRSIGLTQWKNLPWEIRVKSYLTICSIDLEAIKAGLTPREKNICRWAALYLHIGCAKKSKTSKIYVYSFLSALLIIQMMQQDSL